MFLLVAVLVGIAVVPIEVALSDLMTRRSKALLFATLLVTNVLVVVSTYLLSGVWIESNAARVVSADITAIGVGAVAWLRR